MAAKAAIGKLGGRSGRSPKKSEAPPGSGVGDLPAAGRGGLRDSNAFPLGEGVGAGRDG